MTTADETTPGELVFITYDDGQTGRNHDKLTRRIVRKKAFNASREKTTAITKPKPLNNQSLKDQQHRFRIPKETDEGTSRPGRIPKYLSALEPLAGALGNDAYHILSFYHHKFRQNSLAINVEGDWLAFALSDIAVAHAQLALVALTMDIESKRNIAYLRHSSAALNLIREKLSESSAEPDDALIGAVSLLLIAEAMQTEERSSSSHFEGLDTMLTMRGGYAGIAIKVLQRVIAWARRCYCFTWQDTAISTSSTLRYHCKPNAFEASIRHEKKSHAFALYGSVLPPPLLDILALFSTIDSYQLQSGIAMRRCLSDTIYEVEHSLKYLPEAISDGVSLSELFQIAAHVYLLLGLRQLHKAFPIVQTFVRLLSERLQVYYQGDFISNRTYPENAILLWIEAVHRVGAIDSEPKNESNERLHHLMITMDLNNWEDFHASLRSVAWIQGIEDVELRHIK